MVAPAVTERMPEYLLGENLAPHLSQPGPQQPAQEPLVRAPRSYLDETLPWHHDEGSAQTLADLALHPVAVFP